MMGAPATTRRSQFIERLFFAQTAGVVLGQDGQNFSPTAEDLDSVRGAAPRRQLEFIAGRICARQALQAFGVMHWPLRPGRDRAPIWPEGFVGSISHCPNRCVAVVGSSQDFLALGFDVEPAQPLETRTANYICTGSEIAHFRELGQYDPNLWATLAFSAKESAFKAYSVAHGYPLDFPEIHTEFQVDGGALSGLISIAIRRSAGPLEDGPALLGKWAIADGYLHTGVSILKA